MNNQQRDPIHTLKKSPISNPSNPLAECGPIESLFMHTRTPPRSEFAEAIARLPKSKPGPRQLPLYPQPAPLEPHFPPSDIFAPEPLPAKLPIFADALTPPEPPPTNLPTFEEVVAPPGYNLHPYASIDDPILRDLLENTPKYMPDPNHAPPDWIFSGTGRPKRRRRKQYQTNATTSASVAETPPRYTPPTIPGITQKPRPTSKPQIPDAKYSELSKQFLSIFKPWRARYTRNTDNTPTGWKTISQQLTTDIIQKALAGETTIGFYSSFDTPILGIDLDDHDPAIPYPHATPSQKTIETYFAATALLNNAPSLVLKSPRGLHVYYLLDRRIYWEDLHNLTLHILSSLQQTGKNPIELKPTPRATLRIPNISNILSPDTLQPFSLAALNTFSFTSLHTYDPSTLFGSDYRSLYRALRSSYDRKHRSRSRYSSLFSNRIPIGDLKLIEKTLLPFISGATYETVFEIVFACNKLNMPTDEIASYIVSCAQSSPDYHGDLCEITESLLTRIEHITGRYSTTPRITVSHNSYDATISHITSIHPFAPQRTKSLTHFLKELFAYKDKHDAIFAGPEACSSYDSLYPYYRVNRAASYYPLPTSLLRKWHSRYFKILTWLISIGLLAKSPHPYSPSAHICNYYSISLDLLTLAPT